MAKVDNDNKYDAVTKKKKNELCSKGCIEGVSLEVAGHVERAAGKPHGIFVT